MTEIAASKIPASGPTRRWLTPLLITAYIVAILLISGLSKARDQQTASVPIGETLAVDSPSANGAFEASATSGTHR